MPEFDLRLHGGELVLPGGKALADVCVRDGLISAICEPDTTANATEVVDIPGLTVIPGAIDAHVHLGKDLSFPKDGQDVERETASAASGGVTTILAYLMSPDPYEPIFASARDLMEKWSHTDFGFHFCVVTPDQVRNIGSYCADLGVSSFKVFTNFRGNEGSYLGLPGIDDAFLFEALQAASDAGAMIAQHAENIELVWRIRDQLDKDSADGLRAWNLARPDYVEAEAEGKVAYLASVLGASSYAVHVTSSEALSILRLHRQRYRDIYVETCPHYLTLDEDTAASHGSRAKVNPPLRTGADREALWQAVADGTIDTIGSDHVPRHFSNKDKDIWSASAGFPGTGTLLPLVISEGFKRGIGLERIVELTAQRPAQLFGLWPRKGAIAVGADADLAILDLNGNTTVAAESQHSGADYSVWEGWNLDVRVVHTLLRGSFAVRDGELRDPRGAYLRRPHSGRASIDASNPERS